MKVNESPGAAAKDEHPNFLSSPNNLYKVEKTLGEGDFGTVVQCTRISSHLPVAVKLVTNQEDARREVKILRMIKALDPDKHNLLQLLEPFTYNSYYCFVFELLDVSISKLLSMRNEKFKVSEIRPVAQQMLVALRALKSMGLIHTDVKPDNIMLVDHKAYPFKVKLIDFGLAKKKSTLILGKVIQPIGYRAPEVALGLPIDEGVDLWSLGCVLASMYIGRHLYPTHCPYELVRAITRMQGPLPDDVLIKALRWQDYFSINEGSTYRKFRIKTPKEYMETTGCYTHQRDSVYQICSTLNELPKLHQKNKFLLDEDDTAEFLSLLRHMLMVDARTRITPHHALVHNFITMRHFANRRRHPYVQTAYELMAVCQSTDPHIDSYKLTEERLGSSCIGFPRSSASCIESTRRFFDKRKKRQMGRKTFTKKVKSFFSKLYKNFMGTFF